MHEFARPFRRKLGAVTLVLACLLTAGWIRSLTVYDFVCFPQGKDRSIVVFSAKCCLYFKTMHQVGLAHVFHRRIGEKYSDRDDTTYLGKDATMEKGFLGFRISDSSSPRDKWSTRSVLVPYWSIALPLTLLSAYLLLCKARATTNHSDDSASKQPDPR